MKEEIQGRIYDTATATKIAICAKEFGVANGFRHIDESLYRTEDGCFFLAGGGGAMTRYVHPDHDRFVGGEGILVLTDEEARHWCEEHDVDEETIAALFEEILA